MATGAYHESLKRWKQPRVHLLQLGQDGAIAGMEQHVKRLPRRVRSWHRHSEHVCQWHHPALAACVAAACVTPICGCLQTPVKEQGHQSRIEVRQLLDETWQCQCYTETG